MNSKRSSITLSIKEYEKAQLEQLALEFDQTWGDKPNISKLIKTIAQGKLRLAKNHDWSRDRIDTLNHILNWLKDDNQLLVAQELANLLLERSELNAPLRYEIQTWVNNPGTSWRQELEKYIQLQRPFCLTYQDATDLLWHFTVRHARINRHEDRHYLDCWCEETEGNKDIDALKHNWSLRLDRIPEEAVISRTDGTWRPELSHILVEFHLLGGLAFGYHSKTKADLESNWLPDSQTKRVVRRLYNSFWFFREVRRYGADCVVISPEEVRNSFFRELEMIYQSYLE